MKKHIGVKLDQLYSDDDMQSEVGLWRAVVMQNLEDLKLPKTNKKYRSWLKQAIKWFSDADEDFYLVCEFANFSAHKILQHAHHIMVSRKDL